MKIKPPTIPEWKQIDGDLNIGAYGGTIARSDGEAIELIQIQPVRGHSSDSEAAEVGYPFWTKEGYFDLDDLREALKDQGFMDSMDIDRMIHEMEWSGNADPETIALLIASSMLDYGFGDEGTSGWSSDIDQGFPADIRKSLEEEDEDFRREVLGEDDEDDEEYEPNARRGMRRNSNDRRHEMVKEWEMLLEELKRDLDPVDDDDDDEMMVTIATDDDWSSWGYQTGDNSFTGGAYGFPYWAVVYLYPDADAKELAKDALDQLQDLTEDWGYEPNARRGLSSRRGMMANYRLRDSDKRVIKAFVRRAPAKDGHALSTDGRRLVLAGLGGGTVAEWVQGSSFPQIRVREKSSRTEQTIERFLRKTANPIDFEDWKPSGERGMRMRRNGRSYQVQPIHKYSNTPAEKKAVLMTGVFLPDTAFAGKKELGRALRDARVLPGGARVREMRIEGESVVVFPSGAGSWHAYIMTPED